MDDDKKFWQQVRVVLQIRVEDEAEGHPASGDLVRYFEGTYKGDRTKADIEKHVQSCSSCQQELDAIRGSYASKAETGNVFTLRSALDRFTPFTLRYLLPIAAVLLLALLFLWNPFSLFYRENIGRENLSEHPPGGSSTDSLSNGAHSLHVRKHLAITLIPQISFRGPAPQQRVPQLSLEEETPLVAFTLLVRRTDLPSSPLSMTLVTPDRQELSFPEKLSPAHSTRGIDTLRVTLDKDLFSRNTGVYKIRLTEASPTDPNVAREATYPFEVTHKK